MQHINIVLIGPKHSGKTIFLTALANCSSITVEDPESIASLNDNWKLLQKGETPPATAGTLKDIQLAFRTEADGCSYNVNILISDYDGHFAETLSRDTEDSPEKTALCKKIREANGFIFFFPSADEDDLSIMEELRMEIGYFISLLREIYNEDERIATPVVLAVNKWDKNSAFQTEQEDRAAAEHIESVEIYRVISDKLKNFFSDLTILPMSAYGHKTPDSHPVPGQMHPYRTDEAILILVRRFFSNLQERVSTLEANGQFVELAEYLLYCAPLWRRCEGFDYADMLEKALDRSSAALFEKVRHCTTLSEFDSSFHAAPEHSLQEYFSDEQQQRINDIRQALQQQKNKKRLRLSFRVLSLSAVLLLGGYMGHLHYKRAADYSAVMNSTASVYDTIALLNDYEKAYANNPLLLGLYRNNLTEVRNLRDMLVKKMRDDFSQKMAQVQTTTDACERAALADHLLSDVAYIEPALTDRVQTLLQQSQTICQCRASVEDPQVTRYDLDKLRLEIKTLPDSEEVKTLLARIDERSESLRERDIAQALDQLSSPTQDNDGYEQAKQLLMQYADDPSATIQTRLANIRQSLGERLYYAILHRVSGISEQTLEKNIHELREFISREAEQGLLSEEYKQGISNAMQRKVEAIDRAVIAGIGREILSLNDLADREETLHYLDERLADVTLDYGLFRYQRPWDLSNTVELLQKDTERYKNALTFGLDVDWYIYARKGNPLGAGCGWVKNNELTFQFSPTSGQDVSGSSSDSTYVCNASDMPGFESRFSFGTKTIFPSHGTLTISQTDTIDWLKESSTVQYLNITEEDIFSLLKSGNILHKQLGQDFALILRRR